MVINSLLYSVVIACASRFSISDASISNSWPTSLETDEETTKHILLWTNPFHYPFRKFRRGRRTFIAGKCRYTNCYVTADRDYLGDYTNFDVIAFHAPNIVMAGGEDDLPKVRSPHQKYIFACEESADNYPLCHDRFDGFFNATWTYKLDSDLVWNNIVIRDSIGRLVGPSEWMLWPQLQKCMEPIAPHVIKKLRHKYRAAAWFASNCKTRSERETLVRKLNTELSYYNLSVDVYGTCGKLACPKQKHEECSRRIQTDYYFYLSFENSFAEDYVTEKLLNALENYAVPIVLGGADYSRFLPEGSYLDALELTVEELAWKMYTLIRKPAEYHEYFRWRNHYRYEHRERSADTSGPCALCAMLNDQQFMERETVQRRLRDWWTPVGSCW